MPVRHQYAARVASLAIHLEAKGRRGGDRRHDPNRDARLLESRTLLDMKFYERVEVIGREYGVRQVAFEAGLLPDVI